MKFRLLSAFFLTTAVTLPASAHIRFLSPAARYENPPSESDGNDENIKNAPCGVAGDSRTTDTTRITVFEPGETITVQWKETINHPGHYRIAFDDDGQDAFMTPLAQTDVQASPVLPVLADDIADITPEDDQYVYEQTVTLPNMECETCTLQLIQVMSTAATWSADDIYFTCADIAIRAAGGSGGSGGIGGVGGSGGTAGAASGAGGTGGVGGTGGTGGASAGGSAGATTGGAAGSTATAGTGNVPRAMPPAEEEGSCSLGGKSSSAGFAGLLLVALAGAVARRRRRS